ncbi:WXG100 family type VII secretion target [Streptoalloteichus tenebrarius]|uniref:WXG100 family type VII secretion target n=1 Tax=Streptoalloteichus tenebrarius (strain ATCC 17920 / DSM 40477 / JCM 4838 / CBS 697.72 / NBRC 16177 / NCIMB 11028 / NRRL B-12390 / A12253. 1 / ISP 5477) TaxID=1933 RepID=UPI0027E36986|nr:WXG100 family type VII secretion target [Streptoalloteichus tenebrarius]
MEAGSMAKAVSDFQDAASAMKAQMDALQSELAAWALTGYQGAQADAFRLLHQELQDEQAKVRSCLEFLSERVQDSSRQMFQTDDQLRQDFQGLRGLVNGGDGGDVLNRLRGAQ